MMGVVLQKGKRLLATNPAAAARMLQAYMAQDMSQEDMYNLLTTKWLEPELNPDGSRATSTRSSAQSSWRVTEDIFSSVVHLTTSYTVVSLAWMCLVGDFCTGSKP